MCALPHSNQHWRLLCASPLGLREQQDNDLLRTVCREVEHCLGSMRAVVYCKYAGVEWKNKEGFFRVSNAPEGHPWQGKIVCMDWDAFCTECLEDDENERAT